MFDIAGFFSSARLLTWGVFRNDSCVNAEMAKMTLARCMGYGWLCLFASTLISALYQYVFSTEVLVQLSPGSAQFLEMSKSLQAIMRLPIEELVERIEIVRVSSFASVLLSPLSSWFFLYLLAGALFFFSKLVAVGTNSQNAYEEMIKIVSIGQAPLLLSIIPAVGPLIGNIWSIWFIAKCIGNLFQINLFTRASIVVFCSFVLFSVWNSTLTTLAMAYRNSKVESTELSNDMI